MTHKQVVITGIILTIVFYLLAWSTLCHATPITDEQGVACILGEARGEGYAAMLGHAEAIRARGTIKGVYGCTADYHKEMPYLKAQGILTQAKKAWQDSKHTHTVKGATYWGSLIVDKAWINKMEKAGYIRTAVINHTAFYRKD